MSNSLLLAQGGILGVTIGFLPGPLMTVIVSETLKGGYKAGIKVAVAPIVTDLPILIVASYLLTKLARVSVIPGLVAAIGAVFLLYLAYESFTYKHTADTVATPSSSRPFILGTVTNLLNPGPYIFHSTVTAPVVVKALSSGSPASAIAFVGSFLGAITLVHITIALFVGKMRSYIAGSYYVYILRFLGIVLLLFAGLFIKQALQYFIS